MPESKLMEVFNLKHPMIVAPMAGGPTTPELVAESGRAGALGSFGAAYSNPSAIEAFSEKTRSLYDRSFLINLFVPQVGVKVDAPQLEKAIQATEGYRKELGLSAPTLVPPYEEDFQAQFEAVLRVRPAALSFIFGIPEARFITSAKNANVFLIGTATTLEEALALEASGMDAITLQGVEAGGHRGIFKADAQDEEVSTFDLLDACASKIKIPLIAAGGIMSREDIRRALTKGAQAVQMGTAFLACKEAGTSAPYRKKLLETSERTTRTTRAFSGRLARGIENRFMTEMEKRSEAILPFPAQNKFTRDLRNASTAKGLPDFLSLWSGTGAGELFTGPVSELISSLFQ